MAREIKNLKKRNAAEKRFRIFGALSVAFALAFLAILFVSIFTKASGAFWRTEIALEVSTQNDDFRKQVKDSLRQRFSDAKTVSEINSLYQIVSKVSNLEAKEQSGKSLIWVSASSKVDMFFKHNESSGLNENQLRWLTDLKEKNQIRKVINWKFGKELGSSLKISVLVFV